MNNEDILVLAGDKAYLPHMKATAVNCRAHGQWNGEICFVLGNDAHDALEDLVPRGIRVLMTKRTGYYTKFALFNPYFRRWRRAFYTDCDVLVQRPLAPLFELPLPTPIMMDKEPFTFEHAFTYWDKGAALREHPELAAFLWHHRDPKDYSFCTANIIWEPRRLSYEVEYRLNELEQQLRPINTHCGSGTDQSIINVLLHDQITAIPDKLIAYWGVTKDGAPPTVLVHYVGANAPWTPQPPEVEQFINPVLRRPCYDLYCEMRCQFDKIFPKR